MTNEETKRIEYPDCTFPGVMRRARDYQSVIDNMGCIGCNRRGIMNDNSPCAYYFHVELKSKEVKNEQRT